MLAMYRGIWGFLSDIHGSKVSSAQGVSPFVTCMGVVLIDKLDTVMVPGMKIPVHT